MIKTLLKIVALYAAISLTSTAAPIYYEVPIHVVSFANDDGSNNAADQIWVNQVFREMNRDQYNVHNIHLVVGQYTQLNSTQHNTIATISESKQYVDQTINRTAWGLASFFKQNYQGGQGTAWGGGSSSYGISVSGVAPHEVSALAMAHEVGHNLGLKHLIDNTDPAHQPANNPNNRMWGGENFENWQAEIMKNTNYAIELAVEDRYFVQDGLITQVPEPSSTLLVCLSSVLLCARRRRAAN